MSDATVSVAPAVTAPGRGLGRLPTPHWTTLLPWVVPVLVLVGWQWASSTGVISAAILPPPTDVVDAARSLWSTGELQSHILVSLRRIAVGFVVGAAIGLAFGFAVGLSRIAEGLFDRTLQMVRALPHLALVPLLIAAFGIGEMPKVLLVTLGVIFPVYLNTVSGIRTVDEKLIQLGRSYGLGRGQLIREVIVPGAMPMILTGIRYALGVAWLTLVIAETIATREGIGYLAQNGRDMLRNERIVLAIVLYAGAGLLADQITRFIEARVLRWNPNYRKAAR
ncbi:sulfonate transport system permease protein [Rhodococcus rhodochrous J3]|uniref:ABC transporter permease subunit n=2 Tax=Rhodococcus rhodochrous TaxID=1829 RepID=A0AA46WW59_RHORH|nr:ABC transporter permease subunit [Rhodococcus rhodochrous]MBF4480394.1 ABC transporter permease subunit [Rhodococcus rhodochrous]MCB8911606.1 ABC transporter permease subunit [Rhodococcus rhodochrous]MDO1486608.1 ABC transporter permease subunit [Rhodococcus rhodochrous]TWH61298.1 sulfonate transport system permease protein [Rhodococcus rhodochrous J38]UZF45025.1 ABC transporter permease subunit [Rhodococcus rhodochrous]